MRALLLDVGSGHDFGGEVKPFAEVVETLGSEGVVVPLPRELSLEVAPGGERLAGFNDLQRKRATLVGMDDPGEGEECAYIEIFSVDFAVLGEIEVLLSDEYALWIIISPLVMEKNWKSC